jgi:hypothetical protein
MSETVEIELLEIHNEVLTWNIWSFRDRRAAQDSIEGFSRKN